jgi:hypothetical protein
MKSPFDPLLNVAIVHIASRLLPDGFDVSDEAPDTYEKLKAHLCAGKRMIVWSGGSEATVYGHRSVNFSFRAWHDFCHWDGGHDFTLEGEIAACEMQCQHLFEFYGECERIQDWCSLLRAEIVGQALFFHRHKRFPDDQRSFVAAYLVDPAIALIG